jgi:MSHA biogenesis protein MshO
MPSPGSRFHVVSGPVTYHCGPQADGSLALSRQWGYPIAPTQSSPPPATAQQALIAGRVADCRFEYRAGAGQRSALVVLTLVLQPRNASDARIRLVHQVHVDNTP